MAGRTSPCARASAVWDWRSSRYAAGVRRAPLGEKIARFHWTTPEQEKAAFAYSARHRNKHCSFIDCLSFVVMDAFGITEAWAVASDFSHRFVVRPGPSPG